MFRPLLIGLVAGQRAMTPLAMVATAARRGTLRPGAPGRDLLASPIVAAGAVALAAAEMAGDKMPTAPDRVIPAGLVGRTTTAAFAGAMLAKRHPVAGAVVAATTAYFASKLGFALRMGSMQRWSQARTGFVEDAIVLAGGLLAASGRQSARA